MLVSCKQRQRTKVVSETVPAVFSEKKRKESEERRAKLFEFAEAVEKLNKPTMSDIPSYPMSLHTSDVLNQQVKPECLSRLPLRL